MNGRRKLNRKSIHIHRNYTAEEAARALGVHRQTVRRWIKSGQLPAIVDQKPMLVLGSDLVDFITSRNKPKHKLELNEFRCFGCQVPRTPAFDAVEFHTNSLSSDRLVALCCKCGTVMYKGLPCSPSGSSEGDCRRDNHRGRRTPNGYSPSPSNYHLQQEPKTHA